MKRLLLPAVILLTVLAATGTTPVFSQPPQPSPEPAVEEARALAVVPARADQLWAVWEVDDGTDVDLYFSYGTDGTWAASQPVFSRPQAWDRTPSLAVAADGTVWLAWSSSEKADPTRTGLYISRWTGRRWTDPETVPLGDIAVATEPALAVAPDNTLWLAWVGFDGVDEEIFASHRDGMSWSLPQQVSTNDQDPLLYDVQPCLAVGKSGGPWLAWTGHQGGVDDEIYVSRWTGTEWTPEQMISEDDNGLDVWPSLVLDAQDRPWVAWDGQVSDEKLTRRIYVSYWDPSLATWTAEEMISFPTTSPVDDEHPTLSLDASGRVRATWIVSGPSDSALGYAWYEDRWTEPRLAQTGVNADVAFSISGADDTSQFLWIDASADLTKPMEWLAPPDTAQPLPTWMEQQATPEALLVDPIWNRHLAFGDSITWGEYYGFYSYPARLEDKLDARVVPSEVINSGLPSERTGSGKNRIGNEVSTYLPQFVIIMEGTNDVSHFIPPSEVQSNLMIMADIVKQHSGIDHLRLMYGTLIPRIDDRNRATNDMNAQGIAPAAAAKHSYLCNPWQAYYNYGHWQELYIDNLHPNEAGLQLLADTFYSCSLAAYTWLQEDTIPPTTQVSPLPSTSPCGNVLVQWSGTDNISRVVDYDVQVQVDYGAWTDWLLATQATSATYTGGAHLNWLGFRVRGRDLVGNQSDYAASSPVYTQILDTTPPTAHAQSLPPYQVAPFTVSWSGSDACSAVVAYKVEYKVGAGGTWQSWIANTAATSASFDPPSPQYSQTYYFRVSAQDGVGLWSPWSGEQEAYTVLARYAVSGNVYNVRHRPIPGAQVVLVPAAAYVQPLSDGGFKAYLMTSDNYEVTASRSDRFGALLPMQVAVSDDVNGLEFVLPPQDDVVNGGDFEAGDWSLWQVGGTVPPTLTQKAHTGSAAARLGGVGGTSRLSQSLTVPVNLSNATLSFMVRLDDAANGSSLLRVELEGTTILLDQVVSGEGWTHVWLPVEAALGKTATLTFSVLDKPAVLVDEASLGTARPADVAYLPIIVQRYGQ
jgi:lysophospholipase L1-like esterase